MAAVVIGLTGGIGAGKTVVATLLAQCGAVVVDADHLAREVTDRESLGLLRIVAEFGLEVLTEDGSLDRDRLGSIVFSDQDARARLNAIVHPLVAQRSAQLVADAPNDSVVVYDVPLLVENNLAAAYDLVFVVEAPIEQRIARLKNRGMSEQDIRARISAQADDATRAAVANVVIMNDGTFEQLEIQVRDIWKDRVAPLIAAMTHNSDR